MPSLLLTIWSASDNYGQITNLMPTIARNIPTKSRTTGRGTNKVIIGTMTVEVPNPVAVPRADAASASRPINSTPVIAEKISAKSFCQLLVAA